MMRDRSALNKRGGSPERSKVTMGAAKQVKVVILN